MREKFARFMAGRCGIDQLNRFLSILSLVLMIVAVVFNGTRFSRPIWLIAFICSYLSTRVCCREIFISAAPKIRAIFGCA